MTSSPNYVRFRAGDEILCLPKSVVDNWTPSQWLWANVPSHVNAPIPSKFDSVCELAARQYNAIQTGKKWNETYRKYLPERHVNRFQTWLRFTLLRYGLI